MMRKSHGGSQELRKSHRGSLCDYPSLGRYIIFARVSPEEAAELCVSPMEAAKNCVSPIEAVYAITLRLAGTLLLHA